MLIQTDFSVIRKTRWHEYAVRFALGGSITVAAGLIAKHWGPVIGGLFLAFPAIFPATVTLAEKREIENKHKHGLAGVRRGRQAAAAEGVGTVLGCLGLMAFGCVFWLVLPHLNLALVFVTAIAGWGGVAVLAWSARKHIRLPRRRIRSRAESQRQVDR